MLNQSMKQSFSSIRAAYIVSGARTPIGSFLGKLSKFKATDLGAIAIRGALDKVNIPNEAVDEVILGNVCSAGLGQSPARQATLKAQLPQGTPATAINKVCSSGIKTIALAAQSVSLSQNELVVAGGFECMSNVPHYVLGYRKGLKFGNSQLLDGLAYDGLTDIFNNIAMGLCAEKTVSDLKMTRELQDDYTISSYERTIKAIKEGRFKEQIVPVQINEKELFSEDEELVKYRKENIPQLRPAFSQTGTITAGNSSKISDGACSIVVASEEKIKLLKLKPLARIVSYADAEVDPVDFCIAPAKAAAKALQRAGMKMPQIEYHEINEAFAATVLANMKLLDLHIDKVNVFGGAVALGHPIGTSGARIVLNLISVLKANNAKFGMASICNGGGGSTAMIIENLN